VRPVDAGAPVADHDVAPASERLADQEQVAHPAALELIILPGTSFFKVNVWRGRAEHLAESLSKGDRVMVTGRLRQRSWETPEGERRSVAHLEADEVGASLKLATAKVERATSAASDDRR
jgi:single stranded DNA-binding protein